MTPVFTIEIIEDLLDGGYVAFVKEYPGCATQGDSLDELLQNVADVLPEFVALRVAHGTH